MNFSKSKYCLYCQCPKILWLNKYKPEVFKQDSSAEERFEKGNDDIISKNKRLAP